MRENEREMIVFSDTEMIRDQKDTNNFYPIV